MSLQKQVARTGGQACARRTSIGVYRSHQLPKLRRWLGMMETSARLITLPAKPTAPSSTLNSPSVPTNLPHASLLTPPCSCPSPLPSSTLRVPTSSTSSIPSTAYANMSNPNPGAGHEYKPFPVAWLKRDVLLFANSIGCTDDELNFLYVSLPSLPCPPLRDMPIHPSTPSHTVGDGDCTVLRSCLCRQNWFHWLWISH